MVGAPVASLGWGLRVGMDDPMLAGQVRQSALDGAGGSRAAWTYRVLVGDDSDEERSGTEESTAAVAAESTAPQSDEAAPRAGVPRRELLVALLLSCFGGAAGYYAWWFQVGSWFPQASWTQHLDVLTLTASGVVAGLLLGWAWMRWAVRKH